VIRLARLDGSNSIWRVTGQRVDGFYRLENDRTHCFAAPVFVTIIAGARHDDPDTSHAAAEAQTIHKVRAMHNVVMCILEQGPATDFDLARKASLMLKKAVKQTSIRVRRKELERLGLVCDSGRRGVSDTGTSCVVWQLTNAGRQAAAA
jgi:hypothetical protein